MHYQKQSRNCGCLSEFKYRRRTAKRYSRTNTAEHFIHIVDDARARESITHSVYARGAGTALVPHRVPPFFLQPINVLEKQLAVESELCHYLNNILFYFNYGY